MLVGPSSTGKSTVWKLLLESLEVTLSQKTRSHVIDPKAVKLSPFSFLAFPAHSCFRFQRTNFLEPLTRRPVNGRTVSSLRSFVPFRATRGANAISSTSSSLMETSILTGLRISTRCLMITSCSLCPVVNASPSQTMFVSSLKSIRCNTQLLVHTHP